MKGDFSRFTFDRRKHYADVRLQQGRVQLDADWNEQLDIAAYHRHTLAADLIGHSGAPETDGGFDLVAGNPPLITRGRYYVDGLLCENEVEVPIDGQPDLPGFTLPTADGAYLAYLDVWQRSVTALEDPDLLELALRGADTATRLRTVWQVKLLASLQTSFSSAWEPDSRSRPTLAVRAVGNVTENQLYRIEVHKPGPLGEATFKWSRDNGSIAALIENPANSEHIQVTRQIGSDQTVGFETGRWIEVTDETRLLQGDPGILARLSSVAGQLLDVEEWPDPSVPNLPNNPQIRLWDSDADPLAQRPPTNDGYIDLDGTLEVRFGGLAGAYFRTGDYWVVPVRAAAGVLWPADDSDAPLALPPHGVQHHYAPLYALQLSDGHWTVTDLSYRKVFQGRAGEEKLNRTADDKMSASLEITGNLSVDKKVTVGLAGGLGGGLELLNGPLVLAQGSGRSLRFASSGSFLREDNNKMTLGVQGSSASLGLSQAGNERLTITSTGRVGIRTTSPQQDVHIAGDGILLQPVTGVTISGNLTAEKEVTVGRDNVAGGKLTLRQAPLVLATGAGSERGLLFPSLSVNGPTAFLRYDNSVDASTPRLTLGTDSPSTLVLRQGGADQITLTSGDVNIAGDEILLRPITGVTVEKALTITGNLTAEREVTVGRDSADGGRLVLRRAPLVLAAGAGSERGLLFPSLSVNGPTAFLRYENSVNPTPRLTLGADSPAALVLSQGAFDQITLTNGRVGIRTNAPEQDVHIAGAVILLQPTTGVTVKKALTYADGSESAGRVLTSDAGGRATWKVIGPVFITPVKVDTGGLGSKVWTSFRLSPNGEIPSDIRAVILEAEACKYGPDSSGGDLAHAQPDSYIRIRPANATDQGYILLRGRAFGDSDNVAWSNQGVFPVANNSFHYTIISPVNPVSQALHPDRGFQEWTIRVVGYFP